MKLCLCSAVYHGQADTGVTCAQLCKRNEYQLATFMQQKMLGTAIHRA